MRLTVLVIIFMSACIGAIAVVRSSRLRLQVIGFIARHPSVSRIFYNRVFRTSRIPRTPNSFLEDAVRGVKPGTALDITMGEGRNAVLLAMHGWDVTGFDISEEALSRAGEVARRSGVNVNAIQSTSAAFDYGADRWNLLVLSYAWAPISDPAFANRLKTSLRKGGLVVFEHFLHDGPNPVPKEAGAPDPGELRILFKDFEILRYEEVTGVPDWEAAVGGRAPRPLARMIAKKP